MNPQAIIDEMKVLPKLMLSLKLSVVLNLSKQN